MTDRTILIAGYWGFGNVGDEAVLATTIADIRAVCPRARIIVTSERPAVSEEMHGVEAVGWRTVGEYLPAIQAADHVVVGGGGLWNSYFDAPPGEPFRNTGNYAEHIYSVPILARILDKPVTVYCVGGGIIFGDWKRNLASLGLACASTVIARDRRTQTFFVDDLGAAKPILAADPAFRLAPAAEGAMSSIGALWKWAEAEQPIVAVVRQWLDTADGDLADRLSRLLGEAALASGRAVLLLPFDRALHEGDRLSDDAQLIEAIRARLPKAVRSETLDAEVHPSLLARLMRSASAVVSMRLHGCILAVAAEKPLLALNYDPKVRAVLSDIGLDESVIEMAHADAPATIARLVDFAARGEAPHAAGVAARARGLSSIGQAALATSIAESRLELIPRAAAVWRSRLLALGVQARSALDHHVQSLAALARDCVNNGDNARAEALLALLCLADPKNGEWPYLQAVANAALAGAPERTLAFLDDARALGFDDVWVGYVRCCTLAAHGRLEEARAEREAVRPLARGHPALASLETAF